MGRWNTLWSIGGIGMTTIEEKPIVLNARASIDLFKDGYQAAVDKACNWIINTYLGDYVTDKHGNGGIGDNVKLAEDFRKTMEE